MPISVVWRPFILWNLTINAKTQIDVVLYEKQYTMRYILTQYRCLHRITLNSLLSIDTVQLPQKLEMGIFRPWPNRTLISTFHDIDKPSFLDSILCFVYNPEGFPLCIASLEEVLRPFVMHRPIRSSVVGFTLDGLFELFNK